MKIRQTVLWVFIGFLFFVTGCEHRPNTPADVQPKTQPVVAADVEQVVIFQNTTGNEVELQKEVNDWLNRNSDRIEIVRTTQTASGGLEHHLTISVFYKKTE